MSAPSPLEIARDRFLADATQLAPGEEDAHLTSLRESAREIFGSLGLPHSKLEDCATRTSHRWRASSRDWHRQGHCPKQIESTNSPFSRTPTRAAPS